jgi:hypothetical protein
VRRGSGGQGWGGGVALCQQRRKKNKSAWLISMSLTCRTAHRPRRRKPAIYLGHVCVAADGPVTLRPPLEQDRDVFLIRADANGPSASDERLFVSPR